MSLELGERAFAYYDVADAVLAGARRPPGQPPHPYARQPPAPRGVRLVRRRGDVSDSCWPVVGRDRPRRGRRGGGRSRAARSVRPRRLTEVWPALPAGAGSRLRAGPVDSSRGSGEAGLRRREKMDVQFVASVAPIVRDAEAARPIYRDALGLSFEGEAGDYVFTDRLEGTKHFGLWPLSEAASACFGTAAWPADFPVPQASIEFEVADVAVAGRRAHRPRPAAHPSGPHRALGPGHRTAAEPGGPAHRRLPHAVAPWPARRLTRGPCSPNRWSLRPPPDGADRAGGGGSRGGGAPTSSSGPGSPSGRGPAAPGPRSS